MASPVLHVEPHGDGRGYYEVVAGMGMGIIVRETRDGAIEAVGAKGDRGVTRGLRDVEVTFCRNTGILVPQEALSASVLRPAGD